MASTLKYMGKEFAKDIGQAAVKGIGYSILGALSHNLKSRLERKLGTKWFNSRCATEVNGHANMIAYGTAAAISTYHFTQDPLYTSLAAVGGILVGGVESGVREEGYGKGKYPACVYGKVLSIIPDYLLGLYDRAKKRKEEDKLTSSIPPK